MKKLVDLVKIVENNEDCVILEVVGSALDMIKLGCFNGDETMFRLTKGKDHTCTVWTNEGKHYNWAWGYSGTTLVTDALSKKGKLIQQCIEQDFEIYIGEKKDLIEKTLYIKSLDDIKHNKHTIKVMYWDYEKNRVVCHLDGEFFAAFTSVDANIAHFKDKGYKVEHLKNERAVTGCIVEYYNISR